MRDRNNNGHVAVKVYHILPVQGEPADEALLLHLQEISCSQALILIGDFNYLDVCWESNAAGCKQCRRLLEHRGQIPDLDKLTRVKASLDTVFNNSDEPIKEVNIGGSLGCSDYVLVELMILRNMGRAKSIVTTFNFQRAKFQLFK